MSEGIKHEQETWERETVTTPDYREYPDWISSAETSHEKDGQDSCEFIPIRLDPDKYATEEMSAAK